MKKSLLLLSLATAFLGQTAFAKTVVAIVPHPIVKPAPAPVKVPTPKTPPRSTSR